MIQAHQIGKHFGDQTLFSDVTFVVGPRERIGLVGRNGSGKSTLLKIVQNEVVPDEGEINIPKGYRIGNLAQHIVFTHPTVLEEACSVLTGDAIYDTYKAEKILMGLGFSEEDFERPPGEFSGGYQIRINLAKVLVSDPNLLLLDEPTNYLDIISLRWLKNFLVSFRGEVILITHDRDFMDSVSTHTMGIYRGVLKKVKGQTPKFYEQLVEEEEMFEKNRASHERKKKELQSFIDRFGAKASKAAQAQSKMKQLEKMGTMDQLQGEAELGFTFHYQDCPAKTLLQGEGLKFGYDETEALFEKVSFAINRGEKIGIIGKNGKGKSTLLNVLAGFLEQWEGKIQMHPGVKLGYFGQTNIDRLHPENSVTQEVANSNGELSNTQVRRICGSMMFEGDLADKKIKVLSGGERSRVLLGTILAHKTNLLFLDEPTNHLDMESIEILCDEINKYPGAVLFVTHSEMLLSRLADNLIIFRQGGAEFHHGGYNDFLDRVGWDEEIDKPKKAKNNFSSKELKKKRSDIIASRTKELSPLKEQLSTVEKSISDLEALLEKFNSMINEKSAKGEEIHELSQNVGKIHFKIDDNFTLMEELSEKIEAKTKKFEDKLKALES